MMAYSPLQLADAFIRTGELNDALDALNTHLDANPGDDVARRLRASVLRRMEGSHYQRAALDDLSQLATPTADDEVERSILLQRLGEWQAASTAMRRAHEFRPDDERIIERYVMTLERSGQPEQAKMLLEGLPKTWRWLQIAGDLAQAVGDNEAARDWYDAALAQLDAQMDTTHNAFAANLKAVLILKRDAAKRE
jgi:tetratricopeptide (TPR) repeat protein